MAKKSQQAVTRCRGTRGPEPRGGIPLIGWQTPPPSPRKSTPPSLSLSSLLSILSSLLSPVLACLCSLFQAQLGVKDPLKSCLVLSCLVLVCLGLSWPVLAPLCSPKLSFLNHQNHDFSKGKQMILMVLEGQLRIAKGSQDRPRQDKTGQDKTRQDKIGF